jgi:hypothetical protein
MRFKLLLLALPVLFAAAHPHAATPPEKKTAPTAKASRPAATTAFARFNLAPFWRVSATADGSGEQVHNGFFSHSLQRLELVFTSVRRDASQPNVYYVRGKNRRYGIVRSFAGTLTLDKIRPEATAKPVYSDEPAGQPYLATGQFVLKEQPRANDEAYGTFRGQLAVDFSLLSQGRLQLNTRTQDEQTRNGGFMLDGIWKDAGTGAEVEVLVKNGLAVTYQVLEDFDIGGRSPQINRKYARVGWNTYWSNDEWWAGKPVARK